MMMSDMRGLSKVKQAPPYRKAKALRHEAGLSLERLARQVEISASVLRRFELGECGLRIPRLRALAAALSRALGRPVTIDELLEEER
jgi:transcriptional regulator with XRE-family HTH domain